MNLLNKNLDAVVLGAPSRKSQCEIIVLHSCVCHDLLHAFSPNECYSGLERVIGQNESLSR